MSFSTLYEKAHATPIKQGLMAWCPTMDLLAMVTDSDEVTLNRLNGQRVWSVLPNNIPNTHSSLISMSWRPDGKLLAVGCSDATVQYLDIHDGKTINQTKLSKESRVRDTVIFEWMESKVFDDQNSKLAIKHDVRTQLPSLSPLPASSTERMFTSPHVVQTHIHDPEQESDLVRLLALVTGDASFHLLMGSLLLEMPLSSPSANSTTQLFNYCASARMERHNLVIKLDHVYALRQYSLSMFDRNTSLPQGMINTLNDFHIVIVYLTETLEYMKEEYDSFIVAKDQTFDKFSENAESRSSIGESLFTFLMTGIPPTSLQSWLSKCINDRVLKRWEKLCQSVFDNIGRTINESGIQACNRLIIMIEGLRKASRDPQHGKRTRLEESDLNVLLKTTEFLVAQMIALTKAMKTEQELFLAFCKWLSYAIDRAVEEDDEPDTLVPVMTSGVVEYIRHHLGQSAVHPFFVAVEPVAVHTHMELDLPLYTVKTFSNLTKSGTPTLFQTLEVMIAAGHQMMINPLQVLTDCWHVLDTVPMTSSPLGLKVASRSLSNQDQIFFYTAFVDSKRDETDAFYIIRQQTGAQDVSSEICQIVFDLGEVSDGRIQDLHFIDDTEILILIQDTKQDKRSHLIAVEYISLKYHPHKSAAQPMTESALETCLVIPSKHRKLDIGVHPTSVSLNGRKGRRSGVYLQADRQRYTVFDLDDDDDDDDDDGSDTSAANSSEGEDEDVMDADA